MCDLLPQKKVSVVKCDDYDRDLVYAAVKDAISLIGGIGTYVSPGQRVFLKFNLLIGSPPERCVTTHPDVVYAVAKILKEHGCHVIMGDSPGSGLPYNKRVLKRNYADAGYDKISAELDIPLNYDTGYREVQFSKGKTVKKFSVINPALDSDAIIVVSKAKTHSLTYLSGGAKNLFGVIPGFEKPLYHSKMPDSDDFSSMIIDLNNCILPRLQIMDAVFGMEGDGPHSGTPRRIGVVMASDDSNAIDVITARLMSIDPMQIGTIKSAVERDQLKEDFGDISIFGEDPSSFIVNNYKHPSTYLGQSRSMKRSGIRGKVNTLILKLFRLCAPWPSINLKKCTGCMNCVRSCPKKTIEIVNKKPEISYDKCIRCYCCHEMCGSHAISLKRYLAGKFMAFLFRL